MMFDFLHKNPKTKQLLKSVVVILIATSFVAGLFTPLGVPEALATHSDSTEGAENPCATTLGTVRNLPTCAAIPAAKFVSKLFFDLTGWFVIASGELLDISINFSLDTRNYKIEGVTLGWEIFRDFANMMFIFILLYIAVMTILQLGSFETKRVLATLIIVALLVNFSFFLTGIVIDAGNILAGFLYSALTPTITVGGESVIRTLGDTITGGLDIPSLLDENAIKARSLSDDKLIIVYLLGSAVFLIAGFVLLAGAILFILRTVALLFVLIVSPLAFVAAILPKTKEYWSMWMGHLIGKSFVAPIYLLMITIVVAIINSDSILTAAARDKNNLVQADQTLLATVNIKSVDYTLDAHIAIVLNYVLIIGLLIATLSISERVAGRVGSMSRSWARKITGTVAGTAMGGAALAYRHSVGRFAQSRAASDSLKELAKTSRGAALRLKMYQGVAGSTGDVRNIPGVGAGIKSAGKAVGVDVGKGGGKGGFSKIIGDKIKKEEKFADSLDMTDSEREAYAKRQVKRGSISRLGMWTSETDRQAGQRTGKLKERAYNRGVERNIDKLKIRENYNAKQQAVTEATQDLEKINKAYAQARSDDVDKEVLDRINDDIKISRHNLSDAEKPLAALDALIKDLNSIKKKTGKSEKSFGDSLEDYFSAHPQDKGDSTS